MPGSYPEKNMEEAVAKKMSGDESKSEYPIEVEIKICATDYADLKRRLPLLFK
jgi:D-aminopeptidase